MRDDSGFVFDGHHSGEMGVIVTKDATRTIAAPGNVLSYEVGGVNGTMAFGDRQKLGEFTRVVTLYADRELGDETSLNLLWGKLVAWLTVGRRELIWDSDPDRCWTAEVVAMDGTQSSWIEEGLRVQFRIQPVARSRYPGGAVLSMGAGMEVIPLTVVTGLPAPICIHAAVGGDAPLTAIEAAVGGHIVRLDGMEIRPGERLEISMERPIGARIIRVDGASVSAMPYARRFDLLESGVGPAPVTVLLEYGEGSPACVVRAQARGCWR